MTDVEILNKVKQALGITGDFFNETISVYIDEIKDYMLNAGVSEKNINKSVGIVSRGVNDLWNNQSGNGKFSAYFYDRVIQLAIKSQNESEEVNV